MTSKLHENDTKHRVKTTPETMQKTTKTSKSFKQTSSNQSLCQGMVAGLPQAVGFDRLVVSDGIKEVALGRLKASLKC